MANKPSNKQPLRLISASQYILTPNKASSPLGAAIKTHNDNGKLTMTCPECGVENEYLSTYKGAAMCMGCIKFFKAEDTKPLSNDEITEVVENILIRWSHLKPDVQYHILNLISKEKANRTARLADPSHADDPSHNLSDSEQQVYDTLAGIIRDTISEIRADEK